jgi:hypothetical protein
VSYDPALLDELRRIYAEAAVRRWLAEQQTKPAEGEQRNGVAAAKQRNAADGENDDGENDTRRVNAKQFPTKR